MATNKETNKKDTFKRYCLYHATKMKKSLLHLKGKKILLEKILQKPLISFLNWRYIVLKCL